MRFIWSVITAYCLAYMPCAIAKPPELPITGGVFEYTVRPGDYLIKIGARFGVAAKSLSVDNGLDYNALLMPGTRLVVDNRHIVPVLREDGLLINVPQRMLYFFRAGELMAAYPVALGKPSWPTPTGEFRVIEKLVSKTWRVPKSIQEEMRREGLLVKTEVPPGPDNPLGKHWLGLSLYAIGIHGTIAPASIYDFRSHGCIRMHPDDIESLFTQLEVGESGSILYAPILLTEFDGRIFLEVHQDIYNKGDVSMESLMKIAHDKRLNKRIDWIKANDVLLQHEGIAYDVTLETTTPNGG